MEPYVEKVSTGAIIIISGDYMPVDKTDQPLQDEVTFFVQGETAPPLDDKIPEWKLVEVFDFIS
jgi:hypothetical protein